MSNSDPKGFYADLGVSPDATIDQIKAVYRALAKIYHPDVNSDKAALAKFRRISDAYETLSDPALRRAYDAHRPAGDTASSKSNPKQDSSQDAKKDRTAKIEPIRCSVCGNITAQPRFLTFRRVASFLVITRVMQRSGVFCSACARRTAVADTTYSAALGWWGVPWGPIRTVGAILGNALGGERHKTIEEHLLWHNCIAFLSLGQLPISAALAGLLHSASDPDIAESARELRFHLSEKGMPNGKLKSPWIGQKVPSTLSQLAIGLAVPIVTASIFLIDLPDRSGVGAAQSPTAQSEWLKPADRTPTSSQFKTKLVPPPAPVDLCTDRPRNNRVLLRKGFAVEDGHKLIIRNGSSGDAIAKLRRAQDRSLVVSFFVEKGMTASIDGIADGSYVIQFGFGDSMTADCQNFIDPAANEFAGVQNFETRRTDRQIITSELTLTLYTVRNGNARTNNISASSFAAN